MSSVAQGLLFLLCFFFYAVSFRVEIWIFWVLSLVISSECQNTKPIVLPTKDSSAPLRRKLAYYVLLIQCHLAVYKAPNRKTVFVANRLKIPSTPFGRSLTTARTSFSILTVCFVIRFTFWRCMYRASYFNVYINQQDAQKFLWLDFVFH